MASTTKTSSCAYQGRRPIETSATGASLPGGGGLARRRRRRHARHLQRALHREGDEIRLARLAGCDLAVDDLHRPREVARALEVGDEVRQRRQREAASL